MFVNGLFLRRVSYVDKFCKMFQRSSRGLGIFSFIDNRSKLLTVLFVYEVLGRNRSVFSCRLYKYINLENGEDVENKKYFYCARYSKKLKLIAMVSFNCRILGKC